MNRASGSQSIDVVFSLAGGRDYQEIPNFFVFLIFDDLFRQHSFDVTIIDDSVFELDESFILELMIFDPFPFDPCAFEPLSNVILSPNATTVDIIDNEGIIIIINTILIPVCYNTMTVVIGFLNTSYTVNKDDGLVNIQIGITRGILQNSVAFIFFISQNPSQTDGV